jgi:hypothetical protein
MEKELKELQTWLDKAAVFELPPFNELPSVPLYMEQVLSYVNGALQPLNVDDKQALLTSFMINNYVKARMVEEPHKKKYSQTHLGYFIAITSLKYALAMNEISLLIEMDKDVSEDKSVLYGFFRAMSRDLLQENASKVKEKIDSFEKRYEKDVAAKNPKAEENLRDSLGLIALRLAIQSGVQKILADQIINSIAKDMHGEEAYKIEMTPGHKEVEREAKISRGEAKRLAAAKQKDRKQKGKIPANPKQKGEK